MTTPTHIISSYVSSNLKTPSQNHQLFSTTTPSLILTLFYQAYKSFLAIFVKNLFRATAPLNLFPKMYIGNPIDANDKFRTASV